ncbi:hypothetical protein C7R54_00085 [Achromobacter aloeverae]|uniref:Uncharacterized protein n=1 Tax=Achromobacter aloeverae TaxID=1750518 RepID=A0A4Q1HML5_9BURK|nr:hypothetical protein C7R54_00085 [Achromobacter aloeverae]
MESKEGSASTIMGIDEEAIRSRFAKQLAETTAKHGLPSSDANILPEGAGHRPRIRAVGGIR